MPDAEDYAGGQNPLAITAGGKEKFKRQAYR